MSYISAYQNSLYGIQSGIYGANKAAAEIASANGSPEQLTESLVTLNSQAQQVEASAKALETSNAMLGTILDIKV